MDWVVVFGLVCIVAIIIVTYLMLRLIWTDKGNLIVSISVGREPEEKTMKDATSHVERADPPTVHQLGFGPHTTPTDKT